MCKITILVKPEENALTKSFILELDSQKLPSLNTPYFVQVEKTGKFISFIFNYDDQTSRVNQFLYQPFQGKIGELTGRVFVLQIDYKVISQQQDSKWDHLKDYLLRKFAVDSPTKRSNVELGLKISKQIYHHILPQEECLMNLDHNEVQ